MNHRKHNLLGIDLCACVGSHRLKCQGPCREAHTIPETGEIKCGECYRVGRNDTTRNLGDNHDSEMYMQTRGAG